MAEVEELAASSDRQAQVTRDNHAQKLKALETQILNLKKKQENQVAVLKQKQKSEDAAKRLKAEIQCIKAQKVASCSAVLSKFFYITSSHQLDIHFDFFSVFFLLYRFNYNRR